MRENMMALGVIAILISGAYFLAPMIYAMIGFEDPDEIVSVSVELENRCPFDDKVFVVKVIDKARSFKFNNGKATFSVPRKTKLKLAVSRDFPDFEYSGIPQKISDKMPMKMIADCTTSPRLQSTINALKQQFDK